MVERGWAASFPIYPSLPEDHDMNLLIAAAESACEKILFIFIIYMHNITVYVYFQNKIQNLMGDYLQIYRYLEVANYGYVLN
jgi:hypothetical protein